VVGALEGDIAGQTIMNGDGVDSISHGASIEAKWVKNRRKMEKRRIRGDATRGTISWAVVIKGTIQKVGKDKKWSVCT